jgi:Protein of unknown function (DUF2924)
MALRKHWHTLFKQQAPPHLPRRLLFRVLAYRLQADQLGDLDGESRRLLDSAESPEQAGQRAVELGRRTVGRALCWIVNETGACESSHARRLTWWESEEGKKHYSFPDGTKIAGEKICSQ